MNVIQISNLSFKYQNQKVFNKLSFELTDNQWLGILGVNGAGKSTFLKILLGHLVTYSGEVQLMDHSPGSAALKSLLGSSPQEIDFPSNIRVKEILHFVGAHYSQPVPTAEIIDDLLDRRF